MAADSEPFLPHSRNKAIFRGFNRSRARRSRLWLVLILVGLLCIVVGLVIWAFSQRPGSHFYPHAAVASDASLCSTIGSDILRQGGNAVDAGIAALLCMGVADAQSMGIGGGFFMTVYNRKKGTAFIVDAREVAPKAGNETMFDSDPKLSEKGGLSIAVPGEIAGYWMAHQQAGRLPWRQLFQPTIRMCSDGFVVPRSLADALEDARGAILEQPNLRAVFVNPETGELYREGELLTRPQLAATLTTIAEEGATAFYNGSLTKNILADLKENGSIITQEDLLSYRALLKEPLVVTLNSGLRIFSPPPPSSGAVLSFILNVLDGYGFTSEDLKKDAALSYHRIVEAFKFAYAKRTDLGDEDFDNVTQLVANLTSRDYADGIRSLIWDNSTHGTAYYGPTFYSELKTSTAHLSVVDSEGNAVAVTSTINLRFGSNIRGSRTGIIFNDEMDDFSSPNITNAFGIPPSPANFIRPGKRPLSSMCPAIFVEPDGTVRLVVGAAGGSQITTATSLVSALNLWFGLGMQEAIDSPRVHHQLLPPSIFYEKGISESILEGLRQRGHNLTEENGGSVVQGIARRGYYLEAASDPRKGGQPDGF